MENGISIISTPLSLLVAGIALAFTGCAQHDHFGENGFDHYHSVPGWGIEAGHDHDQGIGATHGGIVVDREGRVYVSSQAGIFVFTEQGQQLRSYKGKAYSNIHAMLLTEENGQEYIYGARNNNAEVVKLSIDGTVVLTIPFPTESGLKVKNYNPTAVIVKPNGNILVADGYGSNYLFEFDSSGTYLSYFGGKDMENIEKFKTPHGLTIDPRYDPPRLLVSDREKRRLVHFDLSGNFIGEVYTDLRRPCAVSIKNGYLAIAELEGRVTILNSNNELVTVLGDNPDPSQWANFKVAPEDWKKDIHTAPHGLCWDAHGNLYVQDWNSSGRVTKWTPDIQ